VAAQMEYFLVRRTPRGLVRARDWVVWGNPLGYATGEATTLNVFVHRGLVDAAWIGKIIGEEETSANFTTAATALAQAVNTVLWDEAGGCYFSGYFAEEDERADHAGMGGNQKIPLPVTDHRTPTTLHANLFALDRGVVPPERRARVLAKLLDQQKAIGDRQVMIYYYLARQLYGLDQAGLDTRVLQLFRQNWQPMVDSPWQCSWESLNGGSKAHIYGMFPGYFLSAYVLGVRRDAPVAEKKLLIEPRLGDLTEAKGVVVTEFGPVSVSWKRQAGELVFGVEVPKNVRATLRLAEGDASTLVLDGHKARAGMQGRYVAVAINPGKHEGRLAIKPSASPPDAGAPEKR
jgi:alpha-L-rhamnosidase